MLQQRAKTHENIFNEPMLTCRMSEYARVCTHVWRVLFDPLWGILENLGEWGGVGGVGLGGMGRESFLFFVVEICKY